MQGPSFEAPLNMKSYNNILTYSRGKQMHLNEGMFHNARQKNNIQLFGR